MTTSTARTGRAIPLRDATLHDLPAEVRVPDYNRAALVPGIVHIGVGHGRGPGRAGRGPRMHLIQIAHNHRQLVQHRSQLGPRQAIRAYLSDATAQAR